MISVVIPSYKDPLLHKTIDSLLDNAEGEIEIIVVLDGYWNGIPIRDDPRVNILHIGKNSGMRNAINAGVRVAKGEFIMRTDEHCMFDKGYDVKLTKKFEDNWIVYPMRYYLDPVKWEVMDVPPNIYNKLVIDRSRPKFSGVDWPGREKKRADKMIDESMAMQGSCWIMKRSWWDKVIGELQSEGYGTHYGDSHEMVFKTWKAGGKLMVNKTTWHAHKHRDFPRTHNYGTEQALPGWKYSLGLWSEYFETVILPRWKETEGIPPAPTEKDLTVIYLTASEIKESFAKFQRRVLRKAVGDYPLISVSRKPLDFGINILDDGERSTSNIYRQMLRAAKVATTPFIAIAEDDCLYHENHFNFYRPALDTFCYDQNRFALFTWGTPVYSWRNRKSNCSLIAPRLLLIEALEERFAKWPDGTPDKLTGEVGRGRVERNLGITERKSEEKFAEVSVIQFNHDNSSEEYQRKHRKSLGQIKVYDMYYWRKAEDLITHYK